MAWAKDLKARIAVPRPVVKPEEDPEDPEVEVVEAVAAEVPMQGDRGGGRL